MAPSQPSLQMQLNESPSTTQVPPFSQGLDTQLLFFAGDTITIKFIARYIYTYKEFALVPGGANIPKKKKVNLTVTIQITLKAKQQKTLGTISIYGKLQCIIS